MAEIPKWFPGTIEELYRPDPGQEPSIQDPRVATSHGGGACPVQHWGVLVDGRVFYFRYRHGHATVTLAPSWYESGHLPARDPRTTSEQWDVAWYAAVEAAGGNYNNVSRETLPNLWLGLVGGLTVTEADDGWFSSQEEMDDTFRRCLDEVWGQPFDEEGWELLRQTNWRKRKD